MSFSGGVFTINSAGMPVVSGTAISSAAQNALNTDLATGLSTCLLKDGTQTVTADIPMGGFKLTGLAAGNAAGHSLRYEQLFTAGTLTLLGAMTMPGLLTVGNGVNITAGGLQVSGAAITLTAAAGTGGAGTNWLGGDGSGGLYMNVVTGKTINFGVNNAAATLAISATLLTAAALGASTTWVAGDKYVVIDSSGNFHRSAIGPGS